MTTISVLAQKLRDMLRTVLPHAGEDDSLPVLAAVRFEVRGGTLFLVATDRYTIGVARCRIPGATAAPVGDADALLPLAAAHEMLKLLDRLDGVAAIVFGEDRELTVDVGDSSNVTWATWPGDYPDWRSLLSGMLAGEPAQLGDDRGLNPVHLAKFALSLSEEDDLQGCKATLRARIQRSGREPGQGQPVLLVTREDWFLGAMMPVRIDRRTDAATVADEWAEWAAITTPAGEMAAAQAELAAEGVTADA